MQGVTVYRTFRKNMDLTGRQADLDQHGFLNRICPGLA